MSTEAKVIVKRKYCIEVNFECRSISIYYDNVRTGRVCVVIWDEIHQIYVYRYTPKSGYGRTLPKYIVNIINELIITLNKHY